MSVQDQHTVQAAEPADAPPRATATEAGHSSIPAGVSPLTRDFLTFLAGRPRTYAEAMEAWRTSCPRFPIWEDALSDGLFRLEGEAGVPLSQTRVALTPRGRATLDGA